jgi:hypothetical protein
MINGSVLTALVAGMIGGALAPLVWPAATRAARPTAKRVLRAGLFAYDRGCEMAAEWTEATSDMIAEVQAERAEELRTKTDAGGMKPDGDSVVPIVAASRQESDRKAHA